MEDNHSELGENKIIEKIQDEISLSNKNLEKLTEKHSQLKENDNQGKNQIRLWNDLIKLIKIKKECWNYREDENEKAKENKTKDYLSLAQ